MKVHLTRHKSLVPCRNVRCQRLCAPNGPSISANGTPHSSEETRGVRGIVVSDVFRVIARTIVKQCAENNSTFPRGLGLVSATRGSWAQTAETDYGQSDLGQSCWPKSVPSSAGPPKISLFFFPLPPQFLIFPSLLVFFVEFWWCLKRRCGPTRQGRRGSHTTTRELQM